MSCPMEQLKITDTQDPSQALESLVFYYVSIFYIFPNPQISKTLQHSTSPVQTKAMPFHLCFTRKLRYFLEFCVLRVTDSDEKKILVCRHTNSILSDGGSIDFPLPLCKKSVFPPLYIDFLIPDL